MEVVVVVGVVAVVVVVVEVPPLTDQRGLIALSPRDLLPVHALNHVRGAGMGCERP